MERRGTVVRERPALAEVPVIRRAVREEVEVFRQPEQAHVRITFPAHRHLRLARGDDEGVHPRRAGRIEPFHLAVVGEVLGGTPEEAHLPAVAPPGGRHGRDDGLRPRRHLADEVRLGPPRKSRAGVRRATHRIKNTGIVRARDRHGHLPCHGINRRHRQRWPERNCPGERLDATAVRRVGPDLVARRKRPAAGHRAERPLRAVVHRRHVVLHAGHVVVLQRAVLANLRRVNRAVALLRDGRCAVVLPREERQRARGRPGQRRRIERRAADAVDVRPLRVDLVLVREEIARGNRGGTAHAEKAEIVGTRLVCRRRLIAEEVTRAGNAERRHVAGIVGRHADVAVRGRHEARVDVRAGRDGTERGETHVVRRHVGHEEEPYETGLRAPRRRNRERLLRLGGGHRAHVDRLARVRDGVPDVIRRPRGDERLRAVARLGRRDRQRRLARLAVARRDRHGTRRNRTGHQARQYNCQNERPVLGSCPFGKRC